MYFENKAFQTDKNFQKSLLKQKNLGVYLTLPSHQTKSIFIKKMLVGKCIAETTYVSLHYTVAPGSYFLK